MSVIHNYAPQMLDLINNKRTSQGLDTRTGFNPAISGEKINLPGGGTITGFTHIISGGHLREFHKDVTIPDPQGDMEQPEDGAKTLLDVDDFVF